jgi:hypothetical protein
VIDGKEAAWVSARFTRAARHLQSLRTVVRAGGGRVFVMAFTDAARSFPARSRAFRDSAATARID